MAPAEYTIEVVVENGKIVKATVATTPESLAKIMAAVAAMQAPQALPRTGAAEPALWLLAAGALLAGLGAWLLHGRRARGA
jgi:LPXTG-motif cell wall-anchored protein